MRDFTKLPHHLDKRTGVCRVIIETPKGKRGKFDFDTKTGLFCFKRRLPEGMSFPLDFGFIPSTLCVAPKVTATASVHRGFERGEVPVRQSGEGRTHV